MSKRIDINGHGFTKTTTYTVTAGDTVEFVLQSIARGKIDFPSGNPFGKAHSSFSLPHASLVATTAGTYSMTLSDLRHANGEPAGGPEQDTMSGNLQVNPKPVED
jgi:hypothetical protein